MIHFMLDEELDDVRTPFVQIESPESFLVGMADNEGNTSYLGKFIVGVGFKPAGGFPFDGFPVGPDGDHLAIDLTPDE